MEEHSKADKDFLITNSRILELASKATELFESSKVEEKRQLLGFLLQNCKLKGKELDFTLQKPFDAILTANKTSTWLPLVDVFRNREIEFGFSLQNIQTVFETLEIQPAYA